MTKTSRASLSAKPRATENAVSKTRKCSPRKGVKQSPRRPVSKYLLDQLEQEMLDADAFFDTSVDLRGMFDGANYLLNAGLTEDWDTDFGTYRIDYGKRH